MSAPFNISKALCTASRSANHVWTQSQSASGVAVTKFVQPAPLSFKPLKKMSAEEAAKCEPIHVRKNAIYPDEVDELYADLEERRALMRQPNVSKSYFGNTPENKSNVWNVPIARYRW